MEKKRRDKRIYSENKEYTKLCEGINYRKRKEENEKWKKAKEARRESEV